MFVRAYFRASTEEQDAGRAEAALDDFAQEHGHAIAARYTECHFQKVTARNVRSGCTATDTVVGIGWRDIEIQVSAQAERGVFMRKLPTIGGLLWPAAIIYVDRNTRRYWRLSGISEEAIHSRNVRQKYLYLGDAPVAQPGDRRQMLVERPRSWQHGAKSRNACACSSAHDVRHWQRTPESALGA